MGHAAKCAVTAAVLLSLLGCRQSQDTPAGEVEFSAGGPAR